MHLSIGTLESDPLSQVEPNGLYCQTNLLEKLKQATLLPRRGWTRFKRYLKILLLIRFLHLVFHMSLNSHNIN